MDRDSTQQRHWHGVGILADDGINLVVHHQVKQLMGNVGAQLLKFPDNFDSLIRVQERWPSRVEKREDALFIATLAVAVKADCIEHKLFFWIYAYKWSGVPTGNGVDIVTLFTEGSNPLVSLKRDSVHVAKFATDESESETVTHEKRYSIQVTSSDATGL
jgi:hypothetical protein